MSGRRGSNSRPAAWEAAALPTELLPLGILVKDDGVLAKNQILPKPYYLAI
jgi:hypothetical protein